jgi:hypothetical protein
VDVKALTEFQTVTLVADFKDSLELEATLGFADEPRAKNARTSLDNLVKLGKDQIPALKQSMAGMGKDGAKLFGQLESALNSLTVEQKGPAVTAKVKLDVSGLPDAVAKLPGFGPGGPGEAGGFGGDRGRTTSLKLLALAMHNYADSHNGQFPPAVIYRKDGQEAHYSWRVELLPYLGPEEQALYNEFKKDEAWDSDNNKKLLGRMPKVFALPGKHQPGQGTTHYQLFTGPGTPFNGKVGPRMPAGFPDGTSNTILIVEAAQGVPWSKPGDLVYAANRPVPALGAQPNDFAVAMADGSTLVVPKTVSEKTLRLAINPADGQLLDPDWPGGK